MSAGAPLGKVVVFGATSGIAEAIARLLAARGAELVLVGRDPARLGAVADDARVRGASKVTAIRADLDDVPGHAALASQAAAELGRIDGVVIAQGVLFDTDACDADLSRVERLLRTNLLGPALLCEAMARRLAEQGSGVIAGISSVAGDRGRQSNYAYGAAKAGFSTFLDGLRNRMFRRGVHVVTVKPGFVDTAMTAHLPKNALFASPAGVARRVVRAMERRRDVAYVPGFWRAVMLIVRHVPEVVFKRMRM